jgi:hypothetical protein
MIPIGVVSTVVVSPMLRRKVSNLGTRAGNASGANCQALEDVQRMLRWSDPSLYFLGLVIGIIPIVAVLIRGGSWGGEPTIGLVFCVIFGAALVSHALDRVLRRHSDCSPRPPKPSDPPGDKHTWSLT